MPAMRQKLGYAWRRFAELLAMPYYAQTQTYSIEYAARVKNPGQESKDAWLVLPIPYETPYQQMLEGPSFDIPDVGIKTEPEYANRYAVVKLNCRAGEEKRVVEKFRIKVSPREVVKAQSSSGKIVDNRFCHPHEPAIKAWAGDPSSSGEIESLEKLNSLVVHRLSYGNPIDGLYTDLQAIAAPRVDCGGFSTLLLSLAGSQGMTGRLLCGFWVGHTENNMHAWVDFMTSDGTVVPADPSIENLTRAGRTTKAGRLGWLGSDRIVFSQGCDFPIEVAGQNHQVDILQHPVLIQDPSGPQLTVQAEVISKIV